VSVHPALGFHYFPPGLQLPPQPLRGLLPISLLGERRHDGREQQISAAYLATGSDDLDRIDLEMLREAALTLFNQYFSDKVRAHAYSLLLPVLARYGSRSYLAAYLATGIDLEMLCEAAVMLFNHCLYVCMYVYISNKIYGSKYIKQHSGLLWFEITKMLTAVLKIKFIMSFIMIFGTLSFPIGYVWRALKRSGPRDVRYTCL